MPETAVNEHRDTLIFKGKVGFSWKFTVSAPSGYPL